jgi:hypothetical protein
MFELESRNTTLLAPDETVTPVPPLVTAKTPLELAPSAKMDKLRGIDILVNPYSQIVVFAQLKKPTVLGAAQA